MTVGVIRESAGEVTIMPPETLSRREIDHRVSSSLQRISSLLSLEARRAADASVREALGASAHRIWVVGAIHKQLCRANSARLINIARYLFDLAEAFEQGLSNGVARKRIGVHVQGRMVTAGFASVLGMLITEVVMTVCKHAYGPDEPGDVDICLFFPTKTEFRMEVRDFGGKIDDREASHPAGLESDVIDAMCGKLNATYVHVADVEGTRFITSGMVL